MPAAPRGKSGKIGTDHAIGTGPRRIGAGNRPGGLGGWGQSVRAWNRGWGLYIRAWALLVILALAPSLAMAAPDAAATDPGSGAPLRAEQIDALLGAMTDAELRGFLRAELLKRAAVPEPVMGDATLMQIGQRLREMLGNIAANAQNWGVALANLGERRAIIAERLQAGNLGLVGTLLAWALVMLAGAGAAWAVGRGTRVWRRWLVPAGRVGYGERLVRSTALTVLELAPVAAWVAATVSAAPMLAGPLGAMVDYVWIYEVGVSQPWAAIVVARRLFSPDAPTIRIAALGDAAAERLVTLFRLCVRIGAAGWLTAGLCPTFGVGIEPAILTVATAGLSVAVVLLRAIARRAEAVRAAVAALIGAGAGGGWRLIATAAPVLLGLYICGAMLYWLGHWLESGRQRLDGPVGTLLALAAWPILDRLGMEITRAVLPGSESGLRFRAVVLGAWRMATGIAGGIAIAGLWGLDLIALVRGQEASGLVRGLGDVAISVLLARLAWAFVTAALPVHRHLPSDGAEETEEATVEASRRGTLAPLLRSLLQVLIVTVTVMTVLSSLGVDIGPLLASAGIIGIAIGFGAQSLVRDVFAGAFFLVDDAFRVGEYIELDSNLRGEVEAISIRSLQLRHHLGSIITVPFGELRAVRNHSRDWVIYKMAFRMDPSTDPEVLRKLVKGIGRELMEHPEHGRKFLEPLKSQGVTMVDDDASLVIRVKFKCKPGTQFVLRREVYHRLTAAFAARGLQMARRTVEVVAPPGSPVDTLAAAAQTALPT